MVVQKKYTRIIVIILFCFCLMIAAIVFLNRKTMPYDEIVGVTDELIPMGIETGGVRYLLQNDKLFTDDCITIYYPQYKRSEATAQIELILQRNLELEEDAQFSNYPGFIAIGDYEVIENITVLDQRNRKGITIVKWQQNNKSVYYTTFQYTWNRRLQINDLRVSYNAMRYSLGG